VEETLSKVHVHDDASNCCGRVNYDGIYGAANLITAAAGYSPHYEERVRKMYN